MRQWAAFAALLMGAAVLAQSPSNFAKPRVAAVAIASQFGQWQGISQFPVAPPGGTVVITPSTFTLPDATPWTPFTVGSLVEIQDGPRSEAVTVTAVSCSTGATVCSFAANFTNSHPAGALITTATGGLQEAINYEAANGGGVVVADPAFTGSVTGLLSSLKLPSNVLLVDETGGNFNFYGLGGGGAPSLIAKFSSATGTNLGGSASWSTLTSGTNNVAALLVGTGASLGPTGTGSIVATSMAATGLTGVLAVANGGTGASTLAGANIPVQSGTITTGDCVKWASGTSITDAGAACGSGGGGGVSSLQWDALGPFTGALDLASGAGLVTQGGTSPVNMQIAVQQASTTLFGGVMLGGDIGGSYNSQQVLAVHPLIANDTTTGTTINTLAKIISTGAVITATADTTGAIGIVTGGAGKTGSAQIATQGIAVCQFDSMHAVAVGDWVQISATTAGDCLDAGSTKPVSGEIIGHAVTLGSAGTAQSVLVEVSW